MEPQNLPVYQQRDRILDAFANHRAVVVESPTGSGKTTQLPIILHRAGFASTGAIGVTQPRRIAALSVCDYIAKQLGSSVPGMVGYKMRFEDKTSPDTIIKIMTDGILLQELKLDPLLSRYSMIMVDEAHERSLNIDFVLGMLKRIQSKRDDFSVLISSATINAEIFSAYFDDCPIVRIDARAFPVDLVYAPLRAGADDPVPAIIDRVDLIERSGEPGDILVFLQGERAIKECTAGIDALENSRRLLIVPLYGRLSREEQERVFIPAPKDRRKVIVATNIAETSVTIDGVRFVIDSGFAKINLYNPKTFTSSLIEHSISKASCNQRKGRAGRTAPGTCIRLYSRNDYEMRPLFTTEEIYRTDLSEVVLRMAELGIRDFESFDFISRPDLQGIRGAVETLELLEALNEDRSLTTIGEAMARFPLVPRLSRIIVEAIYSYPNVVDEAIVATSFLSANSPYLLPQGEELEARKAHHTFREKHGDFVSYLELLKRFKRADNREAFCERFYLDARIMNEIENIHEQLSEIVSAMGVPLSSGGSVADYLCAVSRGLIQFVCREAKGHTYRSLTADRIYIHPGSVMFREAPRYIVAGEIVQTSRMFARSVSPLQEEWLQRISPVLHRKLAASRPERGKDAPEKGKRDTTWKIWIGGEEFDLKPFRGKKKVAVLPWEQLKKLRDASADISTDHLRDLRGTITVGGMDLLTGTRIRSIIPLLPHLDLDRKWLDVSPVQENLDAEKQLEVISSNLPDLMRTCKLKPGGTRLGFLCLETNGETFWFRPVKSVSHAVTESLASLEALADLIDVTTQKDLMRTLDETYKRLRAVYEV